MTLLAGYRQGPEAESMLDLAAMIARSGTVEPLAVRTIVPRPWGTPSLARVDAEFEQWAQHEGDTATQEAEGYLRETAPDLQFTADAVAGRSVARSLIDATTQAAADLIVVGSSTDGPDGRVVVGSTVDPLLHSSPVPVAVAPRGYRCAGEKLGRLSYALAAHQYSLRTLRPTAQWAQRLGVPLRLVTFGVRGRTMYPPEIGLDAESSVLERWVEQMTQVQHQALKQGGITVPVTASIGEGSGWTGALNSVDWQHDELLVVGSSTAGPIARVFLGSKSIKIVRHSPVPVLVVPGSESAERTLADGPTPTD